MDKQDIFDSVIENALTVLRLAQGAKETVFKALKEMEKEFLGKFVEQYLEDVNKKSTKVFLAEISKIIERKFVEAEKTLQLDKIAKYVSNSIQKRLTIALGKKALKLPNEAYFNSLKSDVMIMGAPSSAYWRGQREDLKLKFGQQVRLGLTSGENNQQIIQRIVGKNGQPGVMDVARRNAAALVQTSVQAVANDARKAVFLANDDVIKGIKQVSTLDSHTSLICIAYSGCEWNLELKPIGDAGKQKPYNGGAPRHYNCRSVEIPITKTFEELGLKSVKEPTNLGQRASELGPVDVDTTFEGFLKRRGKAYQEEVLGEGRADLWRKGKITLRDLVGANGRPISLSELQRVAAKNTGDKVSFFDKNYLDSLPKKVYQPEGLDSYEKLLVEAEVGKVQFDEAMTNVAHKLGLRTGYKPKQMTGKLLTDDTGFYFSGSIKDKARALEKVGDYNGDFRQLNDMVRGTISVSKLEDVETAIAAMRSEGIDFVARPKDRFAKPTPEGYRDILGLVRLPNGMNAEIQFHVKTMTGAKNLGHADYKIVRTLYAKYKTDGPDNNWSIEDTKAFNTAFNNQVKIYSETWTTILGK